MNDLANSSLDEDLYWKFLTFTVYAHSWAEQTRLEEWNNFFNPSMERKIRDKLSKRSLTDYMADPRIAVEIRANYARGMLATHSLELDKQFGLISRRVESLKAPIDAYYSVHGVGTALVIALTGTHPKSHGIFKRSFTQYVARALPAPFNAICEAVSDSRSYRFVNLAIEPEDARTIDHRSFDPASSELLLAKSLATTRSEMIEEALSKRRDVLKTSRLSSSEKSKCFARVAPISVVDLLYRMRIRSNYGDPYVYMTANNMEHLAEEFSTSLYAMTESLLNCLAAMMRIVIGEDRFSLLENSLPPAISKPRQNSIQLN